MPDYLGDCFYKIADGLSSLPKYSGYRFKEDMVSDAVLHSCKYIMSFNPKKSQNPFAYFTKICYHAFLQRIYSEKKYLYTKSIEKAEIFGVGHSHPAIPPSHHDHSEDIQYSEGSRENMLDFMVKFEDNMAAKLIKK